MHLWTTHYTSVLHVKIDIDNQGIQSTPDKSEH